MSDSDSQTNKPSRRRELDQQIKFALSNLASQNGHHQFEDICRHITRARISSNILPATGPVSAGGDKGRDFQTFRTYLNQEFGKSAFLSLITDRVVVFACSIVVRGIPSKIKSDVTKICKDGNVADVHFFSNQNINVAKRYELQTWAKQTFNVNLEIHDLQSLTELLAAEDTFWIASEHLSIPQELAPISSTPNWYEKLRQSYEGKELVFNFAEFSELKRGIRYATANRKSDISFWLSHFKNYPSIDARTKLSRMVLYEVCVASLRGLETLAGLAPSIEKYFEQIDQCEVAELRDVEILLNYMIGARNHGVAHFSDELLLKWRCAVESQIQTRLKVATALADQAILLQIAGIHFTLTENLSPDFSLTNSLDRFERLETLLDKLPLYPIETLAQYLLTIQEMFGVNERLEQLSRRVESLCAQREADSSMADRDWERATVYLKGDNLPEAIRALHRAANGYLNHESVHESVLSLMALSKVYDELGLAYAARYYAMCSFSISYTARKDVEPKKLPEIAAMLANLEYRSGCWHSFLARVKLFFIVYTNFLPDPNESLLNDESSRSIVMHLGLLDHVTQRMVAEFSIMMPLVESCGLPPSDLEKMRELVSDTWGKRTGQELKEAISEQLDDSPYCDGSPTRKIRWNQLGVEFEITFKNNYATVAAAEQFASVLQILLLDLSNRDLYIVPGLLQIQFSVTDSLEIVTSQPDNSKCIFKVEFPKEFSSDDFIDKVLVSAVTVLDAMSAIPTAKVLDLFHDRMKENLLQKLFFGSAYLQQFYNSMSLEEYETESRAKVLPILQWSEIKKRIHEKIRWNDSPVLELGDNKSIIERRYTRCMSALQVTLPRLRKCEEFQSTIATLKSKGLLDWQILMGMATLVVNYKVDHELGASVSDHNAHAKTTFKYFNREEDKDDVLVPLELFTAEKIEFFFRTSAMSTLQMLGLQIKSITPQISATLEFLKHKCGYSEDVPHEDPWKG